LFDKNPSRYSYETKHPTFQLFFATKNEIYWSMNCTMFYFPDSGCTNGKKEFAADLEGNQSKQHNNPLPNEIMIHRQCS
jgi:hypothetical protein